MSFISEMLLNGPGNITESVLRGAAIATVSMSWLGSTLVCPALRAGLLEDRKLLIRGAVHYHRKTFKNADALDGSRSDFVDGITIGREIRAQRTTLEKRNECRLRCSNLQSNL
jgi:hypothetical protein